MPQKLPPILLFLLSCLLPNAYAVIADYDFIPVSQGSATNNRLPQINDHGQVVWLGRDGATNQQVYFYDGAVTPITNTPGNATSGPQINHSGHLSWGENVAGISEAFFYDGSSVQQLTNNAMHNTNVYLGDNGSVAWDGSGDVFLKRGATVTNLTSGLPGSHSAPRINDVDQVAWRRTGVGPIQVFFYDGVAVSQLSASSFLASRQQINNSGEVVWSGRPSGLPGNTNEIFLYDGVTTLPLTNNSFFEDDPQINNLGQVVWGDGNDIYFFDGATITKISTNPYVDRFPQLNDDGWVVWAGGVGSSNNVDFEIFLYDGLNVHQLTSNTGIYDHDPFINARGDVVWTTGDGPDSEIVLAVRRGSPVPEPSTMILTGLGLGLAAFRKKFKK